MFKKKAVSEKFVVLPFEETSKEPERRLMLGVLEEALATFHCCPTGACGRTVFECFRGSVGYRQRESA